MAAGGRATAAGGARQLVEALDRMEGAGAEPGDRTRRSFHRFPVREVARLEPLDEQSIQPPIPIQLREVSRGGLGFLAERAVEAASMWRVRFERDGQAIGAQPIIVRYCRQVQDAVHIAGGQFIIEPYILALLGVDRDRLRRADDEDAGGRAAAFLSPDGM